MYLFSLSWVGRGWSSIVDIVTLLWAGWSGCLKGQEIFSFPKCPDWLWRPSNALFNGCWGSFPGVKQPGHDVNQPYSSSASVKNEWSYTSAYLACLYGVNRENFAFILGWEYPAFIVNSKHADIQSETTLA